MRGISNMKRPAAILLAVAAACAVFGAAGRAATLPGEPPDPGKSLLEKASKTLGEDKAWTTRVEKGLEIAWNTEGWGTLRADYSRFVKKPDKLKIDRDNSAHGHPFFRAYYYNGGDAWSMANLNAARNPQTTANLKTLLDRVDGIAFYLAACDTFFTAPPAPPDTLLSDAKLMRAGCVLGGDTILFDVDAKTLVLRRRIENKGNRVYIFDDYRKDGARMTPFHVSVYDAGKLTNEFLWKEVSYDVEIDDAIFEEYRPPKQ
jgi:hypothetical protein